MKNYLFSTTRQYNPGDEFILFGVINLLRHQGRAFNPLIYNRNQEVNQPLSFLNPLRRVRTQSKLVKILGSFFRISQVENSFKDIHTLDFVDCIVFAGSPEWKSLRLYPLYAKLNKRLDIPVMFFGLGSFSSSEALPFFAKRALSRASVITYRSEGSHNTLSAYPNALQLPCPALFSSGIDTPPYNPSKRVVITYGISTATKGNHVSSNASQRMIEIYHHLVKSGYQVDIACHYIDEVPAAQFQFPEATVRYSFDSRDYISIYQEYSLVVTSRVHAVGICASLGIPGILIAHDGRASTANGFLAEIISDRADTALKTLDSVLASLRSRSSAIREHKADTLRKYLKLIPEGQ